MTDPTTPPPPDPSAPPAGVTASPIVKSPGTKPHVLSWIALGAAVVGFIFACIPGALILGWILLPIAFILSIVSLFLPGKKWPALTALIVSIVGTIVGFVVFFAVVANAANAAFGSGSSAGTGSSDSTSVATASTAPNAGKSQYAVTIGDSHVTNDYQGKPALVVNYSFTNNSSKDVSFLVATSAKAFQNGVELKTAIISDDAAYDPQSAMQDVKPGSSTQVQEAYELTDKSDVSVEVKQLFSDTTIATKTFKVQ